MLSTTLRWNTSKPSNKVSPNFRHLRASLNHLCLERSLSQVFKAAPFLAFNLNKLLPVRWVIKVDLMRTKKLQSAAEISWLVDLQKAWLNREMTAMSSSITVKPMLKRLQSIYRRSCARSGKTSETLLVSPIWVTIFCKTKQIKPWSSNIRASLKHGS